MSSGLREMQRCSGSGFMLHVELIQSVYTLDHTVTLTFVWTSFGDSVCSEYSDVLEVFGATLMQ